MPTQGTATWYIVPRLELLIAAALFSTGGAAIKACALTAWQVVSFRSLVATLTIFFLLRESRRGWSWRAAGVGAVYALTMIFFVIANKLTTAASTIYFMAAAPLYVLLLAPWFLGERSRARDVVFILLFAAGLVLLFTGTGRPLATAPDPSRGNVAGAASGLFWALTIMGLRWMGRGRDGDGMAAAPAVLIGNVISALICLPMSLPIAASRPVDWVIILCLGIFQIGLAYVLLARGLRHLSALDASLFLLLEPVLSPVWAWLVHGETPGGAALAGGCVILIATAAKAVLDRSESVGPIRAR